MTTPSNIIDFHKSIHLYHENERLILENKKEIYKNPQFHFSVCVLIGVVAMSATIFSFKSMNFTVTVFDEIFLGVLCFLAFLLSISFLFKGIYQCKKENMPYIETRNGYLNFLNSLMMDSQFTQSLFNHYKVKQGSLGLMAEPLENCIHDIKEKNLKIDTVLKSFYNEYKITLMDKPSNAVEFYNSLSDSPMQPDTTLYFGLSCEGDFKKEVKQKPQDIYKHLDKYIVGQNAAKRTLSVAVYNHVNRLENPALNGVEMAKSNILLVGPTGTGKTLLGQTIAKMLDVPFVIYDATNLTQTGYVGQHVCDIFQSLVDSCDGDIDKAQKGIVFIDEIDKLARKDTTHKDISGEGVQQALLKVLEGSKVELKDKQYIDTKDILFIVGGAFSGLEHIIKNRKSPKTIGFAQEKNQTSNSGVLVEDLVQYGMIPELIGRLPIVCTLKQLEIEDMKNILFNVDNSVLRQFEEMFIYEKASLSVSDNAKTQIAQKAFENQTGARGLRGILHSLLDDTIFELDGSGAQHFILTDIEQPVVKSCTDNAQSIELNRI